MAWFAEACDERDRMGGTLEVLLGAAPLDEEDDAFFNASADHAALKRGAENDAAWFAPETKVPRWDCDAGRSPPPVASTLPASRKDDPWRRLSVNNAVSQNSSMIFEDAPYGSRAWGRSATTPTHYTHLGNATPLSIGADSGTFGAPLGVEDPKDDLDVTLRASPGPFTLDRAPIAAAPRHFRDDRRRQRLLAALESDAGGDGGPDDRYPWMVDRRDARGLRV